MDCVVKQTIGSKSYRHSSPTPRPKDNSNHLPRPASVLILLADDVLQELAAAKAAAKVQRDSDVAAKDAELKKQANAASAFQAEADGIRAKGRASQRAQEVSHGGVADFLSDSESGSETAVTPGCIFLPADTHCLHTQHSHHTISTISTRILGLQSNGFKHRQLERFSQASAKSVRTPKCVCCAG